MTGKIFVNYRRSDESKWAGNAIADQLRHAFGEHAVFLDVYDIQPAEEFVEVLDAEIRGAAALLVVLGPNWHKTQDLESGDKRIAQEDDWVRREIRTALELRIPIFPLLLEGAKFPKEQWLPLDIRPFVTRQGVSIRQASLARDLESAIERLAEIPGLTRQDVPQVARPVASMTRRARGEGKASRAPVILAIEQHSEPLKEAELLRAERHLTVTLGRDHVAALEEVVASLDGARSVEDLVELGVDAWQALTFAEPRLDDLLREIQSKEREEGHPQPVAWTGRTGFLTRIYRAILVACREDVVAADTFVSVACGSHYFHPISRSESPRQMQPRSAGSRRSVKVAEFVPRGDTTRTLHELSNVLDRDVLLLSTDQLGPPLDGVVELLPRQTTGRTRVVVGFGGGALEADRIDSLMQVIPCVSLASSRLGTEQTLRRIRSEFKRGLKTQAVPVVLSSLRGELVCTLCVKDGDLEALRDVLAWSTWSWVGLPLFSDRFGEVLRPACSHLMDLRAVSSAEWYYERSEDIPPPIPDRGAPR